jgi:hypothetical protein
MDLWECLAHLPLVVDGYELEPLRQDVSSAFTRHTTVVRLLGGGEEGVGEDVTYGEAEQRSLQAAGPRHRLAGSHVLGSFSELLGTLELFPEPPSMQAWQSYRRWAFESAALDLGLRQAGLSLAQALGLEPAPVRYVVSLRLPDPPSSEPLVRLRAHYPGLAFKLDPTSDWDDELVASLAALGAVETVDLKGAYKGTVVDQPADPALYRRVAEGLPEAWIEDPDLEAPEAAAALAPHRDRITWDAVIHSVADVDALPFPPRMLNVKPSRFGALAELLAFYEACSDRGIGLYGGGQFELGPGRGQIQYLASLFHPDTPNDVAPGGFNAPEPGPGQPASPLPPAPAETGFRWDSYQTARSLAGEALPS